MTGAQTLLEALAARARAEPDRVALHYEGEPLSFGDLWRATTGFAGELERCGLEAGGRVVLSVPNGTSFFGAFYGIQLAGGVPVPLFPGSGPERLIAMAKRCAAELVVLPNAGADDALAAAGLEVLTPEDGSRNSAPDRRPEAAPDDLAYLQFTSGSTGEPKGVEIRHAGLLENIEQMIAGMEIGPRDVFVSWLPVHHDMGLVLMTMVPLSLGCPLYLLRTSLRSPGAWLSEITRRRATFTAAPDFAYRVCLRRIRNPARYDLGSLRVALNAAEPVRRTTLRDFERAFGLDNVMMPAYGLAEATVGVSMCTPGERVRADPRGFVSVGRPFPKIDVEVLLADRPARRGEVGEIAVRSPANTTGYWNDRRATGALFWGEGYIRTGDLGYVDERGELFIVGRSKNLIIQAGRNLAPREIEEALDALPFARASAAVGIDRGGDEGEQVYGFVELKRAAREDEGAYREMVVRAVETVHVHLGLRPGRIYLTPPRALPRTDNGKIRYAALRQAYLDGSLRAGGGLLFPGY